MRRLGVLLLVGLATLLLGGCFRYQSSVLVNDDGSGVAQELLLVDRSVLESLFDSDTEVAAHVPRAADLTLPGWVRARDHRDGRFEGVVMDVTFDSPEQLNERLDTLHRRLVEVTGSRASSRVELQRTDDGWQFSMRTNDLAEVPVLPGPRGTMTPSAALTRLYHDAQLVVSIQLPGRLVDHNADDVVKGRLVWRLSAQSVQTELYARTTTSAALTGSIDSSRTLQIATAAATVAGLATFAAVAVSRRRAGGNGPPPAGDRPAGWSPTRLGDRRPADPGPPAGWPAAPPVEPPVEPATGGEPPSPG